MYDIFSEARHLGVWGRWTSEESGVSGFPENDNIMKWLATIHGPEKTVYEGEVYKLSLEFGSSYPYKPPVVRFISRCFHPNVDTSGNICLDILREEWSALYTVKSILLSIRSLLSEPNNRSPMNNQAALLWSDPEKFRKALVEYQSGKPEQ
ncbi:unnamed protein product [Taenia asiatica]|uniref:UBIQUITIN_CONJUGAT_2 domain-containing protein n=1 Tax=Taenia asiatica TaxID=60517 RepID=A0A0R3WA06_TAEAS|nr:unnamed protein product [Taenia asiatica]